MNDLFVYLAAIGFAVFIFPVHIFNYVYISTSEKYANLNVAAYRIIRFYNVNTVKNKPTEMQINGRNKKMNTDVIKKSLYKIFNSLCIYKIVQLSDIGMKNESNAYVALGQNALSNAIYKFIQINDHYAKLRNYTVMNYEHGDIRYYAKAVTILNLFVVAKILLIILTEKLNELKT